MEAVKEMLKKGNILMSEKKLSEAKALYQACLRKLECSNFKDRDLNSELAVVYNNLGQLQYLNVDFKGAMEYYNKAIHHDPELASAYYNRGTILYRMGLGDFEYSSGDFESAANNMEEATRLNPDNSEFKIGLERSKLQFTKS